MSKLGAVGIALVLLAGCAETPSKPPASAPPATAPYNPRPGNQAFAATWASPLGAALVCGGPGLSNPFGCALPAGAAWGVLPQDGNGGKACVDPEPNVCFQPSGGILGFHAVAPGMALISSQSFARDRTMSIEAVVTVTLDCRDVAYMGPVLYDGEGAADNPAGNYRAEYVSCPGGGDAPKVWVYGPTYAGPINSIRIEPGSTHALRMDWVPGVSITYLVDGVPQLTETPGSLSADPLTFAQDPHPALWFGLAAGSVGRFDVYTGP